jgi:hypothetical protein
MKLLPVCCRKNADLQRQTRGVTFPCGQELPGGPGRLIATLRGGGLKIDVSVYYHLTSLSFFKLAVGLKICYIVKHV